MLKAAIRLEGGRSRLIFGLSDANCAKLIEDNPIAFEGSELGFPGQWFCLTCLHEDGRIAVPGDRPPDPTKFAITPLARLSLTGQATGLVCISRAEWPDWDILVIRSPTEQAMHLELGRFIGPTTKMRVTGFPPGSFQVSQN